MPTKAEREKMIEAGTRRHSTRSDTAKEGYDRLRGEGISHDIAKSTAEQASVIAHKRLERGDRG